jgi:flagellar hook protein FlgE
VRRAVGTDGPITTTNSKTDLAIQGNGFFVVGDANGTNYLTRAGNFVQDGPTGNLVNAAGFTLMGYSLANGEPAPVLNSLDGMVPVNVQSLGMKAAKSTTGTITGNLPSEAGTPPANTQKTSLVVYDTLGKPVTIDITLDRTAAGKWKASFSSTDAALTGSPSLNLEFGSNGKLTSSPAATTLTWLNNSVSIDLSQITQYAGAYDLKGQSDGNAPSAVTGAEFASDGTVYAVYDDGSRVAAFKVPLADVNSPDNLNPRAGNVFETTPESGTVQVGFAGLGGRGTLKSGALEQSNVDVSNELTSMIEAQTVYTANSKVFMTSNEMLDTLMNLKR